MAPKHLALQSLYWFRSLERSQSKLRESGMALGSLNKEPSYLISKSPTLFYPLVLGITYSLTSSSFLLGKWAPFWVNLDGWIATYVYLSKNPRSSSNAKNQASYGVLTKPWSMQVWRCTFLLKELFGSSNGRIKGLNSVGS